jgi:hypothetical protein
VKGGKRKRGKCDGKRKKEGTVIARGGKKLELN